MLKRSVDTNIFPAIITIAALTLATACREQLVLTDMSGVCEQLPPGLFHQWEDPTPIQYAYGDRDALIGKTKLRNCGERVTFQSYRLFITAESERDKPNDPRDPTGLLVGDEHLFTNFHLVTWEVDGTEVLLSSEEYHPAGTGDVDSTVDFRLDVETPEDFTVLFGIILDIRNAPVLSDQEFGFGIQARLYDQESGEYVSWSQARVDKTVLVSGD